MRPVKSLPRRLLVREELAEEARLREALPRNRHRTPISFEEEERAPPVLRFVLEVQAKDPIRLHPQAAGFAAVADLDLPSERKAETPSRFRRFGEYLLGWDEPHPLPGSAGNLECHHDLGDRERMVEEDPGQVPVLRIPPDAAPSRITLPLEHLRSAVPQGIDEGF